MAGRRSASDPSDSVALVTLAAFHGHIDFSPTLQIIAGCCESYPPQLAGRSRWSVLTRQCLSDFEESDILASHWLASTPVYFLPTPRVYLTAYQASCLFVPVGLPSRRQLTASINRTLYCARLIYAVLWPLMGATALCVNWCSGSWINYD